MWISRTQAANLLSSERSFNVFMGEVGRPHSVLRKSTFRYSSGWSVFASCFAVRESELRSRFSLYSPMDNQSSNERFLIMLFRPRVETLSWITSSSTVGQWRLALKETRTLNPNCLAAAECHARDPQMSSRLLRWSSKVSHRQTKQFVESVMLKPLTKSEQIHRSLKT